MLPSLNRLKKNSEIQQVFEEGKYAYRQFLLLKYRPNQLPYSRIAFSVGLKFSKKATDRNRAKRLLRSAINDIMPALLPGYDLVFYLKQTNLNQLDYDTLRILAKEILSRAKLLKHK